jgi:hypothetical protein
MAPHLQAARNKQEREVEDEPAAVCGVSENGGGGFIGAHESTGGHAAPRQDLLTDDGGEGDEVAAEWHASW